MPKGELPEELARDKTTTMQRATWINPATAELWCHTAHMKERLLMIHLDNNELAAIKEGAVALPGAPEERPEVAGAELLDLATRVLKIGTASGGPLSLDLGPSFLPCCCTSFA